MRFAKFTLLALIVCTTVAAGTASFALRGETGPSPLPDTLKIEDEEDAKEMEDQENHSSSAQTSRTSTSGQSGRCMIRRFECAKGALYSCFKRWRSRDVSCTDSLCISNACMPSDLFFATYTLQPWDTGALQGPFPRTETMCVIQRSACPPNEPDCVSAVSLEQISCDDRTCVGTTCTRNTVLVDQNDIIVSTTGGTSGPTEKTEENKKEEEVQKQLEEQQREIEKAREENNNESGKNENQTQQALGCFSETGIWTTDRTKCATNQQPYVQPRTSGNSGQGSGEHPDEKQKIERTIEEKFVTDTKRSAVAQNLLSSTTEAVGRIDRLLANPDLPPDERRTLEEKQESLRTVQRTVSEQQSVRDLQQLANTVSDNLVTVQETARQFGTGPVSPPVSVLDRLDRIFAQIPSIFGLLLNEGVPVDSMTVDAYLTAQSTYDDVRPQCQAQPETCADLARVIDALEPVFAGLRLSLETAGRTDLEVQIDSLLQ